MAMFGTPLVLGLKFSGTRNGGLRAGIRWMFSSLSSQKMPYAPRITVLVPNGVQAKPTRGANCFFETSYRFCFCGVAIRKLLGAEGSKVLKWLYLSITGLLYSQRRPRFSVRFGRTRQSSCTK